MDYKDKVIKLLMSKELTEEQKSKLLDIFPELKESEDEKIRKALIKFMERFPYDRLENDGVSVKEAIVWLEKQGKQKPAEHKEIPTDIRSIVDKEANAIWKEINTGHNHSIIDTFNQFYGICMQVAEAVMEYNKPAEWSEEDKRKLNRIYSILGQAADTHAFSTTCRLIGDKECVELQDFLKSIKDRVQPQNSIITDEELAQAKNDAYNNVLDKIEYDSENPTFDDGWSAAIWYLKKRNAQPQNTWKPSDEQMGALSKAIAFVFDSNSDVKHSLESLYNELKKL